LCAIRPHTNTYGESHANTHTDSVHGEMCAYAKAASHAGAASLNLDLLILGDCDPSASRYRSGEFIGVPSANYIPN
jgi:hypothetical protein